MTRGTLLGKPAISSRHLQVVQAAHRPQGRSNDCGPYSAAMVINALGKAKVDPAQLARELDRVRWVGLIPILRRISQWATFPWGVVDALRVHGIRARWRPFGSPQLLYRRLEQGVIPIVFIGGWRPLWGHVMVLLAYDPVRGWGFANPACPTGELYWLDVLTFVRQWSTYANTFVEAMD